MILGASDAAVDLMQSKCSIDYQQHQVQKSKSRNSSSRGARVRIACLRQQLHVEYSSRMVVTLTYHL